MTSSMSRVRLLLRQKTGCAGLKSRRYSSSILTSISDVRTEYDAIVVGAGHNGLISAAYLAKKGLRVGIFERRHIVGGAAVTEEIVSGYKFSRASYVLSLLRPIIVKELDLKKHGLEVYLRSTSSFTPILDDGINPSRSLCLSSDEEFNKKEISKFSEKDAKVHALYEQYIVDTADACLPLLDASPPNLKEGIWECLKTSKPLFQAVRKLGDVSSFYEFITSPISKILDRWFEADVLKACIATDGIIGAMVSPHTPGSSYVLLHHMLGEVNGVKGGWGFVKGGMGEVSQAIAKSAREHGAEIFVNQTVKEINENSGKCCGITLEDGRQIQSNIVLSNATPKVTFNDLLGDAFNKLPEEYCRQIKSFDYTSPVTKINVAVNRIPNFKAISNKRGNEIPYELTGTIHLNCESIAHIHEAYMDAEQGKFSKRPVIEMCIPSTVDSTLSPPGHHVISLFTQYTPYYLNGSDIWTNKDRDDYRELVFDTIEDYAPGFKNSVVGYEVLAPMDLEKIFGLTGGNIFHGAIGLDQLFLSRPTSYLPSHRTPLCGLYLCGSGTHPGGGVMGSCGRLSALAVLSDLKSKKITKTS